MGFCLYTGNKLERLAERFIEIISAKPPQDPFTPEIVVVQTQGMASWLKLKVGDRGRIAANFDTPFPVNFVNRTLEAVFPDFHSEVERFSAELAPWKIYRILEESPEKYPELAAYLAAPSLELKRWQLAGHLAELFDQYQIYRPEMLEAWRAGQQVEWRDADYQKRLYRELYGSVRSRSSYLSEFFRLNAVAPGKLPQRITMFGVGAMPPLFLKFFLKLSTFTEVFFFYLNPSREYWAEQYSDSETARLVARDGGDLDAFRDGNPLLAGFGGQGREFFRCLSDMTEENQTVAEELFEPFLATSGPGPDDYINPTRLTALQQDIYAMFRRAAVGDGEITGTALPLSPDDRTVSVHNCHSTRREIEVLHDRLLELFEDPAIQPRDVIVMAPDINTYAPYIRSIFDAGILRDSYAISDRSLRRSSRMAECFFELLKLRSGRVEAPKILELLRFPALRNQFNIASDELEIIAFWIEKAEIRWGVDRNDRLNSCNVAFDEYSWEQGLDRLLLGFARDSVFEDLHSDALLPIDLVEGDNAELLGKFITAVKTIFQLRRDCAKNHTPEEWSNLLLKAVGDLFLPAKDEFDEFAALRRAVQQPKRMSLNAGFSSLLPIEVIEEVIDSSLAIPKRNDPFLRGKITFCSLLPMRSIPMQVVAILGLSDGAFPRRDLKFGFNLINRKIAPCDRSQQAEDRYLFLEAILSARRCLMFFYQGQTARANDEFPPAIPLGELIDYLKLCDPDFKVTRHRLQPFEFSYFNRNNRDLNTRSRSVENFHAAESLLISLRDESSALPPRPEVHLPELALNPVVSPTELERFFVNPCRYFLNNRLGIFTPEIKAALPDSEPTGQNINALQEYLLKTEIGAYTLDELDYDTQYQLLKRSCRLPIGSGGKVLFNELYNSISMIPASWKNAIRSSETFAIECDLGGFRVAGTLNASPDGKMQHLLFYSAFKLKHAVIALLRHMILSLANTGEVTTSVLNLEQNQPVIRILDPIDCDTARQALETYLSFFKTGLTHPLPFFPRASWEYFLNQNFDKAKNAFCAAYNSNADLDDPAISLCYNSSAFDDPGFTEEFTCCADSLLGAFSFREESQ
ncbi:MAG: exodeoxyribonuclease V subunit gamma [Victivallales bacterium]|jgi:exodeoxyribonuclease V gamma subunit|nr:exodeoxyribonuclease V subunit gamma [Victivallales bacterium]